MRKIAIADTFPIVRRGIMGVVSAQPDLEVVGEAGSEQELFLLLIRHKPDICIIGTPFHGESGLEVVRRMKARGLQTQWICIEAQPGEQQVSPIDLMNVNGYLLKEALPEELVYTIRMVQRGRKHFDAGLLEKKVREGAHTFEELSFKEKEVLGLIGLGLNNKAIAVRLFISEYLVMRYVSEILAKLNLPDRAQAAAYAKSKGIVRYGRTS
ncbi:LuxR C-terminal-related transcriptional regulator [Paenibacillus gansuensis]|uniref:LuxR C-terminal-related transcriptional regulator n=1 Tax=Paenibacillus gansuensis TaxID=306542 RepID=A0ABW5PJN0_9BACL